MKLVVGLGNVGREYELTRHNIGFMTVDSLAKQLDGSWQHQSKFFAHTVNMTLGDEKMVLAKPDTMMNRSGKAVQALMQFYKVPLESVIVVSDDLDLIYGKIRVRIGGSSGGQNGLNSIIELVGREFVRLRVGIAGEARAQIAAHDYVLQKFSSDEQSGLDSVVTKASEILTQIITDGPEHLSHTILEKP